MIELEDQDEKKEPADVRKNVVKKQVVQVKEEGKPGDIAHYHKKENETEIWDEPCYWVKHRVNDKAGFKINDVRYVGEVIVPQCTADYLAWQESAHAQYEAGIFRGKASTRVAGVY